MVNSMALKKLPSCHTLSAKSYRNHVFPEHMHLRTKTPKSAFIRTAKLSKVVVVLVCRARNAILSTPLIHLAEFKLLHIIWLTNSLVYLTRMVLTDDVYLPTEEEIGHKEIPLTHNYMLSSAMWLGKYCDNQAKEFMLCRSEEGDPRKCLKYGHELTDCGIEFFRKVKKTCREELEWYTRCLDFTGPEPQYIRCREPQALFDGCMAESGFERARFGHFQLLRVHDSDRPRPKPIVPLFPGAVESYDIYKPENQGKAPAGTAGKMWWQVWMT